MVSREVESLLAHDGTGEQHLAEALGDTAQSLFDSENLTGTRLGAWRVLSEIGRGGMGTVYLAARDDDEFQQRVALKVVKRGMDTAELLSSFRRERQILAIWIIPTPRDSSTEAAQHRDSPSWSWNTSKAGPSTCIAVNKAWTLKHGAACS